jgi:hypothetical protein
MSVLLTIEIHESGSIRTAQVYNPATHYRGAVMFSNNNMLFLYFDSMKRIDIDFPSVSHRADFLTAMRDGLDGAADFSLSNVGPVATTTTTTLVVK